MKIASLIPYKIIPPQKGGEKGIYYFIRNLAVHVPVTAYTVSQNEHIGINNVTAVTCLGSTANRFRYINPFVFFRIKKSLKQKQINTIIIEHPYFGWLGILLKFFAGIKLVVHSHNIESARFKTLGKWWWPILYRYERLVHRKASLSLFITEEDRQYAVSNFALNPQKTIVCTYGIDAVAAPDPDERRRCRAALLHTYNLPDDCRILLFAGPLQYQPNLEALNEIIHKINPIVANDAQMPYRIIICGGGLPETYNRLLQYPNMIYAGFVPDIDLYFKGADLFLNPVIDGGGIKTKLVEALAAGTASISYQNGAIGVPQDITGGQLQITGNNDAAAFAQLIIQGRDKTCPVSTLQTFFDHFNWQKIIERVLTSLNTI